MKRSSKYMKAVSLQLTVRNVHLREKILSRYLLAVLKSHSECSTDTAIRGLSSWRLQKVQTHCR